MTFDEAEQKCEELDLLFDDEHDGYFCSDGWRRKISKVLPMPTKDADRYEYTVEVLKNNKLPREAQNCHWRRRFSALYLI